MIINRYTMIKLLSRSVIALTLILGFAPTFRPISVSESNNNLYAQATINDAEKLKTANRLFQEGFALFKQGTEESLLQAIAKWQQTSALYQALGDREGEVITLFTLGRVYNSLGEKQKALDYYNQALPIFRTVDDRLSEAITLNNIGAVYNDLGEKQKALDYYNQALPILRAVGDRINKAATLNNIGAVYNDLGEKQKALDYYNQALSLYQVVVNPHGEALTLNNIGLVVCQF